VTVYRDHRVVFLDPADGKVVQTLTVAAEPYGIIATRDGGRLWVSHEYPGVVSEIDVPSRKVVRTLKAGSFVRGLALSPDESRLHLTQLYTGPPHAIDPTPV